MVGTYARFKLQIYSNPLFSPNFSLFFARIAPDKYPDSIDFHPT